MPLEERRAQFPGPSHAIPSRACHPIHKIRKSGQSWSAAFSPRGEDSQKSWELKWLEVSVNISEQISVFRFRILERSCHWVSRHNNYQIRTQSYLGRSHESLVLAVTSGKICRSRSLSIVTASLESRPADQPFQNPTVEIFPRNFWGESPVTSTTVTNRLPLHGE